MEQITIQVRDKSKLATMFELLKTLDFVEIIDTDKEERQVAAEERLEEITADEAQWSAQFAETDDEKLSALIASVEAEIDEGNTMPMFDEHGNFVEHK